MRFHAKCRPPWLSSREVEIIRLLASDGWANKIAASKLELTCGTLKWYLSEIGKKLRAGGFLAVKNRTALATWAVEQLPAGEITPQPHDIAAEVMATRFIPQTGSA